MGIGIHAHIVHLVDFGLSREFWDPSTHTHIPFNKGLDFAGTTAFASINSHLGLELGRRDDLESLAYVLFYFIWGSLPWQGLEFDHESVLESKQRLTTFAIFHELPLELRTFFKHSRSLSFDGRPDYDHYHCIFNDLLVSEGSSDGKFDWDAGGGEISGRDLRNKTDTTRRGRRKRHMG
jgi:serine/threonine protein kinase